MQEGRRGMEGEGSIGKGLIVGGTGMEEARQGRRKRGKEGERKRGLTTRRGICIVEFQIDFDRVQVGLRMRRTCT